MRSHVASSGEALALVLVFFGLTFLIKDSTILAKARELVRKVPVIDRLLDCSFCTGAWVGLAYGAVILGLDTSSSLSGLACAESLVFYSMFSASASYILDTATQALEASIRSNCE